MTEEIRERLNIPYVRLKFLICFPENSLLPKYKVSALRGGMGEMLLRSNCIRDRNCKVCPFEGACIVRSAFYTRMKRKPDFMQGDDSIGYLIECDDSRTEFYAGDHMVFYLVLFGNNLVYFAQYLQAFYQLGNAGVGRYHSRFFIQSVENQFGHSLLEHDNIRMDYYTPELLSAYVIRREKMFSAENHQVGLRFITPFTVKYQGKYIHTFIVEAIIQSCLRKVMMLDYFTDQYLDMPELCGYPSINIQKCFESKIPRYSSTHGEKVMLHGIKGEFYFESFPREILPYLIAGERIHIGKNTSFDFGRYQLFPIY